MSCALFHDPIPLKVINTLLRWLIGGLTFVLFALELLGRLFLLAVVLVGHYERTGNLVRTIAREQWPCVWGLVCFEIGCKVRSSV